jgi:hypothetical protein
MCFANDKTGNVSRCSCLANRSGSEGKMTKKMSMTKRSGFVLGIDFLEIPFLQVGKA